MMVVGVSVMMGSYALKCYKCNQYYEGGVDLETMYLAGAKCFDPSLLTENDTCEAEEFCAKHWTVYCYTSTIHSFILSRNSCGSSSRHLGDLRQQVE